ncbi:MFS general substrate transporter [Apiospora arundinis]|uniref:MFS general substrate transporter n=1 Tax=Apiospora arundinis TaxID=335852 RepID=A0ABR2JGK0_9PEZI
METRTERRPVTPSDAQPGQGQLAGASVNVGLGAKGWRFWTIFAALAITSLLAAVESTVTSTAMPAIARALDSGELYVWFANAYTLTSTAFLPFFGQIADIFGRRWLTITIVAVFALGSGVSGGAYSTGMLIAGRAVQGVGGGGIILMIEMIICDLVPLRERGAAMGIIFAVFALGSSMGPFIGGIITQRVTWRWVFWINLPIAAVALVLLITFLHVKHDRESSVISRLRRLDYTGNALLVASVTAVLLALTYGGTRYSWSSWHVLLLLVLGFLGLGLFIAYESSRWCAEPMTPPHLFRNRTSAAAFCLTFVHSFYSFWVLYFLPVYFQGVQMADPTRSGVLLLPTVIILVPAGLVSGMLLSKFGKYRVIHLAGFALMTLGLGLFILLDNESRLSLYIGLQFFGGVGSGLVLSTLLPATQAALSEKDTASSTAAWAFIRSLGTVWGVSVPAAIFNSRADSLSWSIDDVSTRDMLRNGQAYSHASADWLSGLPNTTLSQVTNVFSEILRTVWIVLTAIAAVSVLIVFVEKEIKMREELDTEYGISVPENTATTTIEPRNDKEESKAD